jgi:hypothetical protein
MYETRNAKSCDSKLMAAHKQVWLSMLRVICTVRPLFPQLMIQHTNPRGKTATASKV